MRTPRVAVLDPIAAAPLKRLKRHAVVLQPPLNEHLRTIDAIIVRASPVPASMLDRADQLKIIGKHGVGTDNIDLDAANRRAITIYNTPAANADAVAELTVGLMLAVARRISAHDRSIRAGVPGPSPVGRELANAKIGMVGFGTIAKRVARILSKGFGASIRAYDPMVANCGDLDVIFAATLGELVAGTDILSVHVPLTPTTIGLLGDRHLRALARGAIVINTSRGGVVDESALWDLLENGHLSGAGLDVFEREPPDMDLPLLAHPNVIATPHIGASTDQAMDRMGHTIVARVLEGLGVAAEANSNLT